MNETFFILLIIPVLILPIVLFLKLARQKTVLTLWISYVVSAAIFCIMDHGLLSLIALISVFLLCSVLIRLENSAIKQKNYEVIVMTYNEKCNGYYVTNGIKLFLIRMNEIDKINAGDVLIVNNSENITEFV